MMQDLKTSLDDLAQAEYADAPVSTVDIAKARADGRRRARTARLAPVGGGVAVVAACALVVNALGGTSPAGSAPVASAQAGHGFAGTDPLTGIAHFGYLPEGFQAAGHSASKIYGNVVTARTKPEVPWGTGAAASVEPVSLRLVQSAQEYPLQKYETKKAVTVAGARQAFLVTNPGDDASIPSDLSLHWQDASGSWYMLGGDYQIHGTELETMLIKVAGQVSADTTAVALPIHVEGMPKDVVLDTATLNSPIVVGKGGVTVGLEYSAPAGGSFQITATPIGWTAPEVNPITGTITIMVGNPVTSLPGVPKTVDHRVCKDSEGLHVCVLDNASNGNDPLAAVGGARGLLSRITSLGTDPAKWTTHVVD